MLPLTTFFKFNISVVLSSFPSLKLAEITHSVRILDIMTMFISSADEVMYNLYFG